MSKTLFLQIGQTLIPEMSIFPRKYHTQGLTKFKARKAACQV